MQLKVQQVHQVCLFELSGEAGQQLVATLDYPIRVVERYREWQQVYLSFYKTVEMPLPQSHSAPSDSSLRGWTIAGGRLTPSAVDWHSKLTEAETRLLKEFHDWLRSKELFEIRAAIARASQEVAVADRPPLHPRLDVFLTCIPMELARLPWEVWEIGADFPVTGTIRIIRSAAIRTEPISHPMRKRRGRARILAILGDDTGLDFQTDRDAVRSLARMAEVMFVGWQPGQTATEVREQIQQAIANKQGWDVLFFAGHSNETEVTGGELAIAPGVSITVRDIAPQLVAAKQRGLQVAIFNSCSGLNIAESLIDLGFSQVAVMREPIHNRVAQEFLVQFLRSLADHKDVHESLLSACQSLRLEKNVTYPSAYLVPSLFCHPGASLFRIEPFGWRRSLQMLVPNRWETIVLSLGITLSLIPSLQAALLDTRIWTQAVYRNYTGQIPSTVQSPPVALIQIDTASISHDGVAQVLPIDRTYLAQLVDQLVTLNAPVIGIDFVLDTPQPGDAALSKSVQTAVSQHETWFVFAAILDSSSEIGVSQATQIADRAWSLQGYIDADPYRVMLPYPNADCRQMCPFAHLLSLVHVAQRRLDRTELPRPQLNHQSDLRSQLLDAIDANQTESHQLTFLRQLHLSPISVWIHNQWGQYLLEPIIDFSIPVDRVYDRIPASQLLDTTQPQLTNLSQQIVIIAPGDDERTGMSAGMPDRFPVPSALRYWHSQNWLTGGEALAYMTHHQLTNRLVIPVPNLWMVGIAVLLGKATVLLLHRQQERQHWTRQQRVRYIAGFVSATTLYGIAGLQLYISAAILLPWLLPCAIVWAYVLPALRKPTDA